MKLEGDLNPHQFENDEWRTKTCRIHPLLKPPLKEVRGTSATKTVKIQVEDTDLSRESGESVLRGFSPL